MGRKKKRKSKLTSSKGKEGSTGSLPTYCPQTTDRTGRMPAFCLLCDSSGARLALFQSKTLVNCPPSLASIAEPKSSKLCSSPHPSAVSFSSHLHDNRHRPSHKSLPCKTHRPFFFPTSNRKLKIKHNRTHEHQHSYFSLQ